MSVTALTVNADRIIMDDCGESVREAMRCGRWKADLPLILQLMRLNPGFSKSASVVAGTSLLLKMEADSESSNHPRLSFLIHTTLHQAIVLLDINIHSRRQETVLKLPVS